MTTAESASSPPALLQDWGTVSRACSHEGFAQCFPWLGDHCLEAEASRSLREHHHLCKLLWKSPDTSGGAGTLPPCVEHIGALAALAALERPEARHSRLRPRLSDLLMHAFRHFHGCLPFNVPIYASSSVNSSAPILVPSVLLRAGALRLQCRNTSLLAAIVQGLDAQLKLRYTRFVFTGAYQ